MDQHQQLIDRLTTFYRDAGSEAPSTPPWVVSMRRRPRWLQPVLASVALVALAVGLLVSLRTAREHANHVTASAPPTVSASAHPTQSPSPSSSPVSTWITRRVTLGGQVYYGMTLDSSAIFALYTPTASDPHDTSHTTLTRIDRSTGKVITNGPFSGGFQLVRVGAGLWVVGGMSGGPTVDKYWMDLVDPITLQVKYRTWVPGRPGPTVFGLPQVSGTSSFLWLGYGQQAYRLDPGTGKILVTVSFSGTVTSVSIDPLGQRLYVGVDLAPSQDNQDQVVELDGHTGARLLSAPTGGNGLGGPQVVAAADGVWIAYATGMMGAIEHRSAASLALLPTPSQYGHTNGISVFVGGGSVWFLDPSVRQLTCADPRTGAIAASTQMSFPTTTVADSKGSYVAEQAEIDFLRPDPSCSH
jgi:hypothetical protein